MGETWEEYWIRMARDRTWVDHPFIQATAWFIGCDILIADTSCTEEAPYMHISGNIDNENRGSKELIYLGSKINCHYKSLLQIDDTAIESINTEQVDDDIVNSSSKILNGSKVKSQKEVKQNEPNIKQNVNEETDSTVKLKSYNDETSFMYESKFGIMEYKCMSENFIMKCPRCGMETRYIIQNLTKRASCQINIDLDTFKTQFQRFKDKDKENKLKKQRENKQAERAKSRAADEEKVKEKRRCEETARRQKLRAADEVKVKEKRRSEETARRQKLRAADEEKVKQQMATEKAAGRHKSRAGDEEKVMYDQNKWLRGHRSVSNKFERLKQFRMDTMYNAIFICTC